MIWLDLMTGRYETIFLNISCPEDKESVDIVSLDQISNRSLEMWVSKKFLEDADALKPHSEELWRCGS